MCSWVGPTNVAPASEISPPPMWWLCARPPTRWRASRTTTDLPWWWSLIAAVSPANPAPTMATSTFSRPPRRLSASTPGAPASAAPAAPAAAAPTSLRRVSFESCAKREILPTAGTEGKPQPAHGVASYDLGAVHFKQDRVALAAAGADRRAAETPTAPAQLVHERPHDAGARRADGVAQRDRSAVDVDLVLVDSEHAHRVDRH